MNIDKLTIRRVTSFNGMHNQIQDVKNALEQRINLDEYSENIRPVTLNFSIVLRICLLAGLSDNCKRTTDDIFNSNITLDNTPYPTTFFTKADIGSMFEVLLKLRYHDVEEVDWNIPANVSKAIGREILRGRGILMQEGGIDAWLCNTPLRGVGSTAGLIPELNLRIGNYDNGMDAFLDINSRAIANTQVLVAGATGSGKTYLAAFDAMNFAPNRLLYVVHEGSILRKSLETFQEVFGGLKTCGMYTGEAKELEADFIFTTNVSMCNSLELFDKKEFDYIIIDECHHAVASTYRKIIEYFEPEFLLGLTATENRMDNQDVVELFGNNIPYELRLRDAIINDLIVPFHYYGIRDELIDYGLTDSAERRLIAQMSDEENCDFIYQQIEKHRPQGQKLKALAFCRNIQHARMMKENMEEYYHTAFLSGKNKTGERIRAYNDLQSDNKELEILFAVDILNEGVDIPGVNMVLFLRPTESSTIFIQQLGRGLRKFQNKSHVTILDFIGNSYKRSVHIALALGSLSKGYILEKKLLKSMVREDFKPLGLEEYGVKISIDDLSKEEILHHIDKENFNQIRYLKKDYQNFKDYLKTPTFPKHMDYVNSDYAPNLLKFMKIRIDGKKTESYYGFLKGIGEDVPLFTEEQIAAIAYLSSMLPLVRRHEFLIAQCLLNDITSESQIRQILSNEIGGYTDEQFDHALRFMVEGGAVIADDGEVMFACDADPEFKEFVSDMLNYGLSQYGVRYKNDEEDFLLYQDYRQDQALLKILENPKHNQYGTYYKNGNMYIFAGLKKDDSVQDHLNYKDKFLDKETFQWESIANITEKDIEKQRTSKQAFIFVRKVKVENGITLPFTFVGTGQLHNPRTDATTNGSILYDIHMDTPLPDDLMEDFKWTA